LTCYRFLLADPRQTGFLDMATIDQEPGARLLASEYGGRVALELWCETRPQARPFPANDAARMLAPA
jgi:hypothetical protein